MKKTMFLSEFGEESFAKALSQFADAGWEVTHYQVVPWLHHGGQTEGIQHCAILVRDND